MDNKSSMSTEEMVDHVCSIAVEAALQQVQAMSQVYTWTNVTRDGVDVTIHRLELTLTAGAMAFTSQVSSTDTGDEVGVGFVLYLSDGRTSVLPMLCYGIACPYYYEFDIHDSGVVKTWTMSQQNSNVPADLSRIQRVGMYWKG